MAAIITIMAFLKEDKTVYREFQAIKGNLARGVTESGSVDVGTAVVSFEVDISEFTGRGNFTFDTGGLGGPGGDMIQEVLRTDSWKLSRYMWKRDRRWKREHRF